MKVQITTIFLVEVPDGTPLDDLAMECPGAHPVCIDSAELDGGEDCEVLDQTTVNVEQVGDDVDWVLDCPPGTQVVR